MRIRGRMGIGVQKIDVDKNNTFRTDVKTDFMTVMRLRRGIVNAGSSSL